MVFFLRKLVTASALAVLSSLVKRFNHTLKSMLTKATNMEGNDWDELLLQQSPHHNIHHLAALITFAH